MELEHYNDFKKFTNTEVKGLTPYILEEREMRATQMDVFSRLLRDRIIWASGPVNQHMSDIIQAQLLDLDSVTKDKHYLINKFLLAIRSNVYIPRNMTFKDLISSGNLKLLNDITIKNSLIQYYSELENKQLQIKQNNQLNQPKNLFKEFADDWK